MAGALAVATYHSRSLVPAIMAAVIVVVLLPSLKASLLATFPQLGWGTGYGSAWIALLLLLLAFRLREAAFLRDLGRGRPLPRHRALPAAPLRPHALHRARSSRPSSSSS